MLRNLALIPQQCCGIYFHVLSQLLNYESIAQDAQVPARTIREYYALLQDTLMGYIINPIKSTSKRKCISIVDRREAIKTAISLAKREDIILVAGKGHEKYQEIKGVKNHFDDKEIVREVFEMLGR